MPRNLIVPFSTLGLVIGLLAFFNLTIDPSGYDLQRVLGFTFFVCIIQAINIWFYPNKTIMPMPIIFVLVFGAIGFWRAYAVVEVSDDALQKTLNMFRAAGQAGKGSDLDIDLIGKVEAIEPHRTGRIIKMAVGASTLRLYDKTKLLLGDELYCEARVKAQLKMPSPPAHIGGYDQRRNAFFATEVATGFVKEIEILNCPNLSFREAFFGSIAKFRLTLATKYLERLEPPANAVAIALLFGYRGSMQPETKRVFRSSGLAHLLAISGLHMALFAGGIYASVRFVLACIPALVLQRDIRIPSAIFALIGALIYLFISGAGFATQRAFIMIALMLIAIMLRRPALTMANVMIAAFIILILQPSAIIAPGFLMSFGAVISLISFYKWHLKTHKFKGDTGYSVRHQMIKVLFAYSTALILTSLIAGLATGVFAFYFFGRGATYGLIANAMAMPIFAFLVMPLLLVSTIAIQASAFDYLLTSLEWGLVAIINIAQWVSELSGAVWSVAQLSEIYLLCATVFFIGLAAQWWSGRRRIFVLILIIGALTGHRSMTPDLYILGRGGDIAFYNREGLLSMVQKPRNMFVTQQWFDAAGQDVSVLARGCRKGLCLIYLKGSAKVAIAYTRDAVRQACDAVDLVISPRRPPRVCKAQFIGTRDFSRDSVHMVSRGTIGSNGNDMIGAAWNVVATEGQGTRIWHQWMAPYKLNK